jgi:hypothetical protein
VVYRFTHRERQNEWHSRKKVIWQGPVIGQNLELEANFPSVSQCDFTLCDMVEQLERRGREE